MLQSHLITIDAELVGVAIRLDRGYRFVATDCRLYELDETIWPTLADVERLAGRSYRTGTFFKGNAEQPTAAAMQVSGPSYTVVLREALVFESSTTAT